MKMIRNCGFDEKKRERAELSRVVMGSQTPGKRKFKGIKCSHAEPHTHPSVPPARVPRGLKIVTATH